MSNTCIHHRPMPTSLGLSMGFLGVVGLVVSLLSLVPINIYNIYLAISTILMLLSRTDDSLVYLVFLIGSAVSSFITTGLILIISLVKSTTRLHDDMEATTTTTTTNRKDNSCVWQSRLACLVIISQISWAIFGTHLVWFVKLEMTQVVASTTLSVWILWLNYGVLILFSFVLFCASFFIIIGTSYNNNNNNDGDSMGGNSVGEMHQQETTPLLNKSNYHHHTN
ncbi:hypothetical protein BC941DRAFT_440391 [Chlamydoabsidia padenii]|nr:hypothetical protein BC941DRAFT_440391 [Chlamydoabsidia padenii]